MRAMAVLTVLATVAWMVLSGALPEGAALAQVPGATSANPENAGKLVTQAGVAGDMIALSTPTPQGRQLLTIVDAKQRTVAIYHVDEATGEITLRSVRQIEWDLKLSEFNSDSPLPGDIRRLLEQR